MRYEEKKKALCNGRKIPYLGLGTFQLRPSSTFTHEEVYRVLDEALLHGYRLIDTACCYGNERCIGDALQQLCKKHRLKREDLFITSKLPPKQMGFNSTKLTVVQTLVDLQTDYLDLYLVHWPGKSKLKPDDEKHKVYRHETWLAFESLYKEGVLKSIGVSNYTMSHLQELLEFAEIPPALNQVEYHPHLVQSDLLNFCRDQNIFVQAYSSLATGQLLRDENIEMMAAKYHCSSAQLLLKWALQQDVGVIPKSTNGIHLKANLELSFTISADDMASISANDQQKHYCWDPNAIK